MREGLLDKNNTASSVWADTAHRSTADETFMEMNGFRSRRHREKPNARPMPDAVRRAIKSIVRSGVERVFAKQKDRRGLFAPTIGVARARVKIGMATLVYDLKRSASWKRIAAA